MTIKDLSMLDTIGIEKRTGNIELSIIDDMDWENEQEHLELLQEKMNVYLSFIESGEIYSTYPEALNRKVNIKLYFEFQLTSEALQFLKQVSLILKEESIGLISIVLNPDSNSEADWIRVNLLE